MVPHACRRSRRVAPLRCELGIKRTSFQSPPRVSTPHYDLTGYERAKAIARGAVVCNREQIVAIRRKVRAAAS
jgi:hypothetical protein